MSRPHVLLASLSHEGLAVPIDVPQPSYASAHTRGLAARLEGQSQGLFNSFRQAGDLAWRVLMCSPLATARGAGEPNRFGYRLQTSGTEALVDQWSSADLAFFITALLDRVALACDVTGQPVSPLAATGQLFNPTQSRVITTPTIAVTPYTVHAIGGIESKLRAALAALSPIDHARILIPQDNLPELSPEHYTWVERGVIVPVHRIQDVLDALKTLPVLPPAMREVLHDLHAPFEGNPYRGIEAFGIEHRGLYFGRKNRIDEVLSKLPEATNVELPAVLITGYSGSGKSSLMLAGVLGTVLYTDVKGHRFLPQPGQLVGTASVAWRVPSRADATEASLCEALRAHWQALLPEIEFGAAQTLQAFADRLVPLIAPSQAQPRRWVFALDQLEGLVTQVGQDAAAREQSQHLLESFTRFLERMIRQAGVWVLATVRSGHIEALGPLWQRVFLASAHVDLSRSPGTAEEYREHREKERQVFLREVIERPALLAGFALEDELLEDLIRDARDSQSLPLLEFALQALYESAKARRETGASVAVMTRAGYDRIGGIRGAINQRADLLLSRVPANRDVLLGALARLAREHVDASGQRDYVRATVAWSSCSEHEQTLLEPWFDAEHRLLTRQGDQIEVAHEALLREFGALRDWLLSHAQLLRWRQDHLLPQMRRWIEYGKDAAHLLLSPDDLTTGERALALPQLLALEEAELVQASLDAAKRRDQDEHRKARELDEAKQRTLRRTKIGLMTASVLLALSIWLGLKERESASMARQANASVEAQLVEASSRALGRANDALLSNDSAQYYAQLVESLSLSASDAALSSAAQILQWSVSPQGNRPLAAALNHDGVVGSIEFSADGRWMLTASESFEDNTARRWDAVSGEPLGPPLRHEAPIFSARFNPSGDRIVTASDDGTAQMWSSESGLPIGTPMRHDQAVHSAEFSPDGNHVLTASYDGTARVWNAATGEPSGIVMTHGKLPASAHFSPDGRLIATAGIDGTAQIWNASNGAKVGRPLRHDNAVTMAVFSPDGHWIATAGKDGTARLWDIRTDDPQAILLRHKEDVRFVQFSPDGRFIVTASQDGSARIWNAHSGAPVGLPMLHDGFVQSAEFSADARRIITVTVGGPVRVWDARTGEPVGTPITDANRITHARFSPDGRWIVAASGGDTVRVWGTQTQSRRGMPLWHTTPVHIAEFSPDGRWIVTASNDNSIRVWDAKNGALVGTPFHHKMYVWSVRFSPDSGRIVTASMDGTASVLEIPTGKPVGHPMHHGDELRGATFSSDGRWVATGCSDGTARVWDAETGDLLVGPMQHGDLIEAVEISPDNRWVVTAGFDGSVQIWAATDGVRMDYPLHHPGPVHSIQFSPDGRWLATADESGVAAQWDTASWQERGLPMRAGTGYSINSVRYSPDGSVLATASNNGVMHIWEANTGKSAGPLLRHDDSIFSVAFGPDSRRVVTAGRDGSAVVWDAKAGTRVGAPLRHDDAVISGKFSPDGRWVVTASADATARLWPVSADLETDGSRLAQALQALSGVEIDSSGQLRELPLEEQLAMRDDLRRSATGNTAFDQVIRWHFADPYERTLSPFATPTVPQFIESAIAFALEEDREGDDRSELRRQTLEDAYRTDPGHPLILLALSVFEEHPDTVRLWRELTLQRIATDARLAAKAAEILQREGDEGYGIRAADIARRLDPGGAMSKANRDLPLSTFQRASDGNDEETARSERVLAGCDRAVVLDNLKNRVSLRRTSPSGWERLNSVSSEGTFDVTEAVVSNGVVHVAVTRDKAGIATELWRASCTNNNDSFDVIRLNEALIHPELFATNNAVYLFDTGIPPSRAARTFGGEQISFPVCRFPSKGGSGFETHHPCKPGYWPMALSLTAPGQGVQVSCWSGGNAADSSFEVEM